VSLTQALGLGVLQGVTEFLPISSSGHLALARYWLADTGAEPLLFNVVVHLGTLAAIVLVLWYRVERIARAGWGWLSGRPSDEGARSDRRWLWLILLGSVPTALIGLPLLGTVESMSRHPVQIGLALLFTGVVLALSERLSGGDRGADELRWSDALVIGVAQGIGVLPGISRSGITVAGALSRGVCATTAVEFSVLLSIPAVLGANLLEGVSAGTEVLHAEAGPLMVGFVTAFVTGIFALKALQWVVETRRLLIFGIYCAVVGAGAVLLG